MERARAKREIDYKANIAKELAYGLDMMPAYRPQVMREIFCERLLRTSGSRKRFLKHAHHDYDVAAAIHVWNHPEMMIYVSLHSLEEGKDIYDDKVLKKIINKVDRGVMEYVRYRMPYDGRVFTVKTELLFSFHEQFYAIYEERE